MADGFLGAVVPVGGVLGVGFFAVEPGAVGVVDGLSDAVGLVPVVVGVVPEGQEQVV